MENTEQELKDGVTVSPDQLSMLDATDQVIGRQATHLEIEHQTAGVEQVAEETGTEDVPQNSKLKVLAALAILAAAGYIAYWVQEPVQLKADVLGTETSTESTTSIETDAEANTVADATTDSSSTTGAGESIGPSKNVDISLFGFEPAAMQVDKGTTVIWTNTSSEDQTLIGASENSDSFTSPVLTSGATFSKKFDKDGEYTYYSTYNPSLKATIKVGMGENIAEASNTTSTALTDGTETEIATDTSAALESAITEATAAFSELKPAAAETTALNTESPELKSAAADGPQKLSKTGPEDYLYFLLLGTIAYFYRRKLAAVFNK